MRVLLSFLQLPRSRFFTLTGVGLAVPLLALACGSQVQELGDELAESGLGQRDAGASLDAAARDDASGQNGNGAGANDGGANDGGSGGATKTITKLSLGASHFCALRGSDGWCWGSGQGRPGGTFDPVTKRVLVNVGDLVDISASLVHTCAVRKDGAAFCWGSNVLGRLGDGTTNPAVGGNPVRVTVSSAKFVRLEAGSTRTCGFDVAGNVTCWGSVQNTFGATPPPSAGAKIDLVTGRNFFWCGRDTLDRVMCWDTPDFGVTGDGYTHGSSTLSFVSGVLDSPRDVSAGWSHVCAAQEDGKVRCWGSPDMGRVGVQSTAAAIASPTLVAGIDDAIAVAAGKTHSCALHANGTVSCWGDNAHGQLGDGTKTSRANAALVTGLTGVTAIAAGSDLSCAVREGTQIWCWGSNTSDPLGNHVAGDFVNATAAVPF